MIKPQKFVEKLPGALREVVDECLKEEYKIGFIGGVVRDFIVNSNISYDIDIELRPTKENCTQIKDLFVNKDRTYNDKYNILSIKIGQYNIDFSYPRIEKYSLDYHHHNFSHYYSFGYKDEFKRRDLTINAIMIELSAKGVKVIDPYNGYEDIATFSLKYCEKDQFVKDPIRKLRAYRFKESLGFNISDELQVALDKMSIEHVSSHYLKSEAIKSKRPLSFLKNIGVISHFFDENPYNNLDRSLDISIGRSLEIDNRTEIFERLSLKRKSLMNKDKIMKIWKQLTQNEQRYFRSLGIDNDY